MTIMIGIDPHKASHTAVAIDATRLSSTSSGSERRSRRPAGCSTADGCEARCWAIESAQSGLAICWPSSSLLEGDSA